MLRARPLSNDGTTRGAGDVVKDSVLTRARPVGEEPASPSSLEPPLGPTLTRNESSPLSASPLSLWERGFLIIALLQQQDAFLNVVRVLDGNDPVPANGFAGSDPLNVFFVFVTLVGLAVLIPKHREAFSLTMQRNIPILALCGLMVLSPLWSLDPSLSLKRSVVHLKSVLLALYMVTRLSFADAVACVAQSIGIGAVGSLVAALGLQVVGIMPDSSLTYGAWRGVYTHKNNLSKAMAVGAIIESYLLTTRPQKRLHGALLALEMALIILAKSVTSLLTVIVSLILIVILHVFNRRGAASRLMAIATPMAVAVAAGILAAFPGAFTKITGKDASLTGRTELWDQSVKAIEARPILGYGYDVFWERANPLAVRVWDIIGWIAPNAHNGFLEIAIGLGGLGFVLAAAVVLQALGRAVRLFGRAEDGASASTAFVILLGILLESVTEANIGQQGDIDWFMIVFISGACLSLWTGARAGRGKESPITLRARPLEAM